MTFLASFIFGAAAAGVLIWVADIEAFSGAWWTGMLILAAAYAVSAAIERADSE